MWDSRRIIKELTDPARREKIFVAFWRHGDAQSKALATSHLAKLMHFRPESIKKLPIERRADFLASRTSVPEFEQLTEMALMQYHTHEANQLMGAFLDEWKIPHENGTIESDDYKAPSVDAVRGAVTAIGDRFDRADVVLYLATAGLLMGEDWREATWPVVDELTAANAS